MDSVKQEHYTHSKLRERETAVLLLLLTSTEEEEAKLER